MKQTATRTTAGGSPHKVLPERSAECPPSGDIASQSMGPLVNLDHRRNPILAEKTIPVDLADALDGVPVHRRPISEKRRLMLLWRKQNAEAAVQELDHECELFGFTKGQFSLLDLLKATLAKIGPADVTLSTWTANRQEALELGEMKKSGAIRSMRWLVDLTFVRRDPEAAHAVRQIFGPEAIRVANVHSKFATFTNDKWRLVLRTSMNLNMNLRTEDFTIAHDPALFDFIQDVLARIWKHQPKSLAEHRPYDVHRLFKELT